MSNGGKRGAIEAVTRALRERGYRTLIEPRNHRGRAYRPDVTAVREGRLLFVEVKPVTTGLDPRRLDRMRRSAEDQGASFALFQYDPNGELHDVWETTGVEPSPGLRSGRPLDDNDFVEFVRGCAAVEKTLRSVAHGHEVRAQQREKQRRAYWQEGSSQDEPVLLSAEAWPMLVRRLATLGYVESGEYTLLFAALRARDRVVHGVGDEQVWAHTDVAQRLLPLLRSVPQRAERMWAAPD